VEDALRQTEAKYRALIEISRTGFAIVDGTGRVVDANAEYVRLTGRPSLADILGRPVTLWTAPWDLERNGGEIRYAIESGTTSALEVDYRHPDGTIVPIEVNAALIAPDRIMALCRDITSRRQARLALEASEAEARVRSEVELHGFEMSLGFDDGTTTHLLGNVTPYRCECIHRPDPRQ
jgi:PAS domain S-box-containing protein